MQNSSNASIHKVKLTTSQLILLDYISLPTYMYSQLVSILLNDLSYG